MRNRNVLFAAAFAALSFFSLGASAQVINPGTPTVGPLPANGDCPKYVVSGGVLQGIETSGSGCAGAITPSALTRTNDTNVTMTLGGTPATALLQATSLTLGWSGQLALSRGGTNIDNSAAATNDILTYNGTGFIHSGITTVLNTVCGVIPSTCSTFFGYYNVAWFSNQAAAFSALASAGGGTAYYPYNASAYSLTAQTIGSNIKIQCATKGTVIQSSSATANLLNITGTNVEIDGCTLAGFGTPGTGQTAGALINNTGAEVSLNDDVLTGAYIGIIQNGSGALHIKGLLVQSMTQGSTSANGSILHCESGVVDISHLLLLANAYGQSNWPTYGIQNTGCSLDISLSTIINVANCIVVDPSAEAGLTYSQTWCDTVTNGVLVYPNGGTVDIIALQGGWLGADGGNGLVLDANGGVGARAGGTIASATVNGTEIFNYSNASGTGFYVSGNQTGSETLQNGQFTGLTINRPGLNFVQGFFANAGAYTLTASSINGTSTGIGTSGTGLLAYTIEYNRMNGSSVSDTATVAAGQTKLVGNNN